MFREKACFLLRDYDNATLEEQVRKLREENELLYGKLTNGK